MVVLVVALFDLCFGMLVLWGCFGALFDRESAGVALVFLLASVLFVLAAFGLAAGREWAVPVHWLITGLLFLYAALHDAMIGNGGLSSALVVIILLIAAHEFVLLRISASRDWFETCLLIRCERKRRQQASRESTS